MKMPNPVLSLQGERGLDGQRGTRGMPGIGIKGDKVQYGAINKPSV